MASKSPSAGGWKMVRFSNTCLSLLVLLCSLLPMMSSCGSSVRPALSVWAEKQRSTTWSSPELLGLPVAASLDPPLQEVQQWNLPQVSVSALGELFPVVLADLCAQAHVSSACPPALAEKPVSIELSDCPGQKAFEELAGGAAYVATYADGVVTLVPREQGTKDFVVLRTAFEKPEEVREAMKVVLGQNAGISSLGERIIVAGDRGQVEAAVKVAKQFEVGSDGWILEVRLVAVSRSFKRDLGMDWDFQAGIGATADAHTGNRDGVSPIFGARARILVDAIAAASEEGREARLMRSGRLFLLEGAEQARLHQGDSVPVPRRTVSDQGTVTVTGYDQVKTGFELAASARRVPGGVRLILHPSISTITGYVDGAPITSESSVDAACMVQSGEWIVLSGLDAADTTEGTRGIPGLPLGLLNGAEHWSASGSSVLVVVQAVRSVSAEQMRANP